jgi:hypothetical protein
MAKENIPSWAKGLIAIGLTAGVIWLSFKGYKKIKEAIEKGKEETKEGGNVKVQLTENFTSIPAIIGDAAILTPKKDAYIVYVTNPTNKKIFAFIFFSNGRVHINPKGKPNILKGKYFDSGKTITLDNGKSFQYNSVWANMQNIITNL